MSIISSVMQRIRRFARKCIETITGILTIIFTWNVKDTLIALKDYFRETGQWYLGSAAFHALALIILGLISMASSGISINNPGEGAPAFNAVEESESKPPPEFTRFEVGEAPLEPTELNAETLSMYEAKPIASQTAIYYDDSPEFVEAGGGSATDLKGPQLGGLGGFSVKDLPGPAGKGGVGVGAGMGDKPGVGGGGEGFGNRGRGHREALVGSFGGTKASERAVGAALNWLHRHQTAYGKWSLDFRHQCKNGACSGAGAIHSDEAATAMALVAFFGRRSNAQVQRPVSADHIEGAGLARQATNSRWLFVRQFRSAHVRPGTGYFGGLRSLRHDPGRADRGGCAKGGGFYRTRPTPQHRRLAIRSRHPGDTSVTGWQIMALKSAQLAGLPVNSMVLDNAQKWLHSVAKGEHMGLFSYQPYREVTPTMTAVGMLCTQYLGIDRNAPSMLEGKQYLLANLPDDKMMRNTYYWYYATLTMHNFSGPQWDSWNRKMRRILIESQDKEGCAMGSWDPQEPTLDIWGEQGGRLMTTSFNALTLEVYYRYLPIFRTDSTLPNAPPLPQENDKEKDKNSDKNGDEIMPE